MSVDVVVQFNLNRSRYLHLAGLGEERLELILSGCKSKVSCEDLLSVILKLDSLDVVGEGVDDALVRVGHFDVVVCAREARLVERVQMLAMR